MDRELISSEEFIKRIAKIPTRKFCWSNLLGGIFLRYEYLFETDGDNRKRWNEFLEVVKAACDIEDNDDGRKADTKFFSYFETMRRNYESYRVSRLCCQTIVTKKDGSKANVKFNLTNFPLFLIWLLNETEIIDVSVEKIADILNKCVDFERKEKVDMSDDSERVDCLKPMSAQLKNLIGNLMLKGKEELNAEKIVWHNAPDISDRTDEYLDDYRSGLYSPLWGIRGSLPKNVKLQVLQMADAESMADMNLIKWVFGTEYCFENHVEIESENYGFRFWKKVAKENGIQWEGRTLFAAYIPLINSFHVYGNNRRVNEFRFNHFNAEYKYYRQEETLRNILSCLRKMTDGEVIICISYENGTYNAFWGNCLQQLMAEANLHTILRLPYGFSKQRVLRPIFVGETALEAQELTDLVTDVIFLSKGEDESCKYKSHGEKVVWVYDLRTGKPNGKGYDDILEWELENFYKYSSNYRRRKVSGEDRWDFIRWKDIENAKFRLDFDLSNLKYETKVCLPYDLRHKILALKNEEKRELLNWMAEQGALTDSGLRELKKTVQYQGFKEWFYRTGKLPEDAPPMEILREMANAVGRKISDAYAGGGVLDRSGFHRLKTGERELKKMHLVHFVVKLGLNEDYARLLFESAGFYLTEHDAINIRKGKNNDLSYLDEYYPEEKAEKKGKFA